MNVGPGRVASSGVLKKEAPGRLTPARDLIKCACQCSGVLCMTGRLPARPHWINLGSTPGRQTAQLWGLWPLPAPAYQLPSRPGWAANLIPLKNDQGAAVAATVQGPAVAGFAAYSNLVFLKSRTP